MTVFHNARIYTSEGIKNWIKVENGIISEIGTGSIDTNNGVDMKNKIILPGLIDAHLHVFGLGKYTEALNLRGCGSIAELQNRLHDYCENKDGWIFGGGWDQDQFEDNRYPTKEDLDRIIPDNPVILNRACNHVAIVNSKALEIANINEKTINPSGGEIERDSKGYLTGILKENALNIISPFIKVSRERKKRMIEIGLIKCLEVGLTAVQTNDGEAWEIYQELQNEGKVPIRVYLTIYHNEIGKKGSPLPGTRDGLLYCDRVKLFADGSLGAQTAAMREPYTDTGKLGIPIYSQEELTNLVKKSLEAGYRNEIHAIGDRAAEMAINAIEESDDTDRPILTHAQILGKDLIKRMSELNIIANIQPPFIITDGVWVDKRLGMDTERRKYSYAWKTMKNNNVHISGGSDAPIESNNPLIGMYSAIFRETVNGKVWREEEQLTFDEAIKLYSEDAAFTTKEEGRIGNIKIGFKADFIVIEEDVITNPRLLKTAKIVEVYISGRRKL